MGQRKVGRRVAQSPVGIPDNTRPTGTTPFAFAYGMKVVIPIEIGMSIAKTVVQGQRDENHELERHLDWADEQSKIEESSLESLSKSRIQGVWDPAHSTRVGIPSGCRHFPPGCHVPLHPDVAAIPTAATSTATFHPDVSHPEF
ncbi:hypothetical protein CK203_056835 [Vitis vinifera]|uniref:Uncharacterized protein n=1 Tax=Vitis vinifera TaxID=29760 RepID=A0A438GQ99_VITVI|nr:hypothetical protein CK203_056835 [Vitis vinifera]